MMYPRIMMTFVVAAIVVCLHATPADAATTFVGSTVEAIDLSKHMLSIKTCDGMAWTLLCIRSQLLKKQQLAKGEHVSLEEDNNDNVKQITTNSALNQT